MPEQRVTVYFKESGEAVAMHSVDAAEAVRQGEYTYEAPAGHVTPSSAEAAPKQEGAPSSAEAAPEPHARASRR